MRKFYFLMVLLLCNTWIFAQDEIINIPDPRFKQALLKNKEINKNKDGEIQKSEAENYKGKIDVERRGIYSLTGIEYFINISELNCFYNWLKQIDVSKNTKLTKLNCRRCGLNKIDISSNLELIELDCGSNGLTQLDVSKNLKLSVLNCGDNRLSQLYLSNNKKISKVICSYNKFKFKELWNLKLSLPENCKLGYSPQYKSFEVIASEKAFEVDYSSEATINGKKSEYTWYNVFDEEVKGTDLIESIALGKFRIKKQGIYYCKITNPEFKDLTLVTNYAKFLPENEECINIPDKKFKKALLSDKRINLNSDKEIQLSEAQTYCGGIINLRDISDLKGLEYFINITWLDCFGNKFSKLDISKNKKLVSLNCSNNKLTQLDVSQNKELTTLWCDDNNLSQLDVSQNKKLTILCCDNNNLSHLDVSQNKKLIYLFCDNNNLTGLDVSQNKELTNLRCHENKLIQLDISKNSDLTEVYCFNNKLKQLNISKTNKLKGLVCSYNSLNLAELFNIKSNLDKKASFRYSPQNEIFDEIFKTEAFEVDYSSEALINNKKTTYTWYNIFDELVDDVNIIEPIAKTHGKFKIKKQGAYYCEITNPEFSDLTLKTNIVGITIPNQKNINIPDKNFKRALISQKQINTNSDNEIQESEALNYKGKIEIYSNGVSDLTGIEHFTNITELTCCGDLKQLDVSKNLKLTELNCCYNDLNQLDISKNLELTKLNCKGNNLTQLDVSKNTKLTELDCSSNDLTQLDVSKNLELTKLNCSWNNLTQLDISKNAKLVELCCDVNRLKFSELWKIKSDLPTNCTWDYNTQNNIYDEITEKVGFEIDYSNECIFNKNKTSFVWYNTKDNTKIDENSVKQTAEGKFIFLQAGRYYCKMKNAEFEGLELQTNDITIKNPQTITFELAETAKVNDKIVLNAKATSKLDVEYNIVSGKATLDGNVLIPTKEGVLVVKAIQEGNNEYFEAEKEVKIKVSKRNHTITFELADTAKVNDKIVLKAKASSKLGVKYKIVSGKATLEGNILTPTKEGVLVVKALQEGNDEYSAAEKEVSIRILTVGVNSLHKSGIKMYPNPVKEKLFIELTDNANCVISIYNIQGEVLLSKKANSQRETIDLSLLPNGVYFVRIRDPRNTIVHKIIKR